MILPDEVKIPVIALNYLLRPVKAFMISCLVASGLRERTFAIRFATKAAEIEVPA